MKNVVVNKFLSILKQEYVLIFLFTLTTIVVRGYEYGLGNQIHYLTYVNYAINPALYPHDYLLKTHTIPYTIFIDALTYLSFIAKNQQMAIFLLYTALLYLFYLSISGISKKLYPSKKTAWIALLFFVLPLPIGGSTIFTVEKSLIPRFVADVCLVAAIYLLLQKKNLWSAACAAIGFLFHPLTMIPFPLIILVLTYTKNISYKKAGQMLIVFGTILLPLLSKFIVHDTKMPAFMDSHWKHILIERLPYVFVQTWKWYDFAILAGIPVCFLFYQKKIAKKASFSPLMNATLLIGYSLFVISLISSEISLRLGIQLQLPRNLYLPIVLSLIALANMVAIRLRKISILLTLVGIMAVWFALTLPSRIPDGIAWYRPMSDFEKAAIWSSAHTPVGSIFVVPPDTSGFRFWSKRSVVNENKEGGDGLYDRKFALEWDKREDLLEKDNALTTQQIQDIKKKFNATYLVTTKNLPYPKAYASGIWKIYIIE